MVLGSGPLLFGRSDELRLLADVIEDLHRRHGALVLVEGDAGIGKTTFCEAVAAAAETTCQVVWVTCSEVSGLPPFWPWKHFLGELGLPPIATLVTKADTRAARVAAFDAVLENLVLRDRERPLLLVLDDAHWIDSPSFELLRFLSPHLRRSAVAIVLSVRSGERVAGLVRADAMGAFGSNCVRVDLHGLAPTDLEAFVKSIARSGPPPALADELLHRTAGNPLFARELALATIGDSPSIPASITAVFRRRLDQLTPGCRAVLDAIAIVGDGSSSLFLAQVLDRDPEDVLLSLDEAITAQLAVAGSTGDAALIHPLLRETLTEALGVAGRVRWHERIANGLVHWRDTGHPVDISVLAAHYTAAAPAGTGHEAVTYSIAAAQDAVTQLAYESAAQHYGAALRALELAPASAEHGELLLLRGEALDACGRTDEARASFMDAAALARTTGNARLLGRAALAVASGGGFEIDLLDDRQQGLLGEAISGVGESDEPLRARLIARLTIANSLVESGALRQRDAFEALELSRASQDPEAILDSLAAVCDAYAGPEDVERRLDLSTEMLSVAVARGDVRKQLLARRHRLEARLEKGDVEAFDRDVHDFAIDAHRLRQPVFSWYVPLWRATRCWMTGEDDAAVRYLDQAEALGREAGSQNAEILVLTSRTIAALDRDPQARDVDSALMEADATAWEPWMVITRAYARCRVGTFAGTRDELDEVIRTLGKLPRDSEYVPALVQAAGVAVACADAPLAQTLYPLLLPSRGQTAVEGISAYCHGSTERHLGSLAAICRDRSASQEHFRAARTANEAMGAAFLAELTDRDERAASPARVRIPRAQVHGVFQRTGDHWTVGLDGRTGTVLDSKGVRDIARLLSHPGQGMAALDLATSVSARRSPRRSEDDSGEPGDLGELIDARARTEYRQRLVDLEEDIEDADAAADLGRGERARVERDLLLEQLTTAYGIGGRTRRAGDPAERARTTVTARIRDALRHLESAEPSLGAHLRRSIRTGRVCVYDPEVGVRWAL